MPREDVYSEFQQKLRETSIQLCTWAADLIFLIFWLLGEYLLEHFIVPWFSLNSFIIKGVFVVFRLVFGVATLVPCISNVNKHVRIILLRDSAEVTRVKEQLRPTGEVPLVKEQLRPTGMELGGEETP